MRAGTVLGGYRILGELGTGAMGAVYLARQMSIDRLVALKILPPQLAREQPEFAKLFLSEARTAASLDHPNIVAIHDAGSIPRTGQDLLYFAMEYVEGEDLSDLIQRDGPLPKDTLAAVMLAMAKALAHAARRGLVHRDIKPANILLTNDGVAKLADFGLARRASGASSASVAGTPYYMSPEAARGKGLDHRSDQYALGCSLFEALTAVLPFVATTSREVLELQVSAPVPDPRDFSECDHGWAELAMRLMAKQPNDRFLDPAELVAEVERLCANPVAAEQPTPTNNRATAPRPNRRPARPARVRQARARQVAAARQRRGKANSKSQAVVVRTEGAEAERDPIAEALLWPFVKGYQAILATPAAVAAGLASLVVAGAWVVDRIAWAMPFVRSGLHWLAPKAAHVSFAMTGLTWQVRIAGGRGHLLTALAEDKRPIGAVAAGDHLPWLWPAILDDQQQPGFQLIRRDWFDQMLGHWLGRWAQRDAASYSERAKWLRARGERWRDPTRLPPLVTADPRDAGDIDEDLLDLAALTGGAILPIACGARPGRRFSQSPYRHLLPAPGAQILVYVGAPITVDPDHPDRAGRALAASLAELRAIADRAAQAERTRE